MPTECGDAFWDPLLLHYRDQFCRICLNHFKDGSLCPVDSPVLLTTVLEMFTQLTALEADDNIVIPRVICSDCKDKLEHAFATRQEFITNTEFLGQLVAENKIIGYFNEFLYEPDDSIEVKPDEAVGDENESHDHSSYTKTPKQYIDLTGEEEEVPVTKKSKSDLERARRRERCIMADKRRRNEAEVLKSFPVTTCYVCGKQHESIMERDLHMHEHIPMLPYECDECNSTVLGEHSPTAENGVRDKLISLTTTTQLNRHFMMHRMPQKCDQCYRRFTTLLKLKTHQWSSHGRAKDGLTCEFCGKQFFKITLFNAHVYRHRITERELFKCSICNRVFSDRSLLERHAPSHTGEKHFKCMYCDRWFSRSCNRLTHQRTHTGELVHRCTDCGQGFVDSSRLRKHQKSHIPGTPITDQPVKTRSRLFAKVDENGTKRYFCQEEGCTFTTPYTRKMSKHKANHIKKFGCDECGKRFATSQRVRSHKASMHSGNEKNQNHRTAKTHPPAIDGDDAAEVDHNEQNAKQEYLEGQYFISFSPENAMEDSDHGQ